MSTTARPGANPHTQCSDLSKFNVHPYLYAPRLRSLGPCALRTSHVVTCASITHQTTPLCTSWIARPGIASRVLHEASEDAASAFSRLTFGALRATIAISRPWPAPPACYVVTCASITPLFDALDNTNA
ncbi:hypothetical protein B0H16DRAFT_1879635 [Mycena metata]|uniref:Uncharacterized protein n=1 Tax=Mycena metata TaxID=1033252 RepID=A0AAD7NV10_9AGAR|nr:hypothetical protein B0H16DRAFT_1879635 [Mycena metata]